MGINGSFAATSGIAGILAQPGSLVTLGMLGGAATAAVSQTVLRGVRGLRGDRPEPARGRNIAMPLVGRDALTRFVDYEALRGAIAAKLACPATSALILIRLESLDAIVACHGYGAGEKILIAISERLRALWPTECWARIAGSDLGLVLGGITAHEIEAAALAILRAVEAPVQTVEGELQCSASLGIVRMPELTTDVDTTIKAALSALGRASSTGGGQWAVFDPERHRAEILRSATKEELRSAIENGQIIPYYQPIVDLWTGRVVGLEVLARWQHPIHGELPPDLFIPMAEELHLAGKITQVLIRRVLADSRHWPNSIYFAFNASPGQLRELIGLIGHPPVWPEGTLDPKRLEIEITESALIEDIEVAKTVIDLLQANGTRVVLDDFGTGYSNFFHLRELPFDKIKIDKSFVLDLGVDPRADACVKTMLALGASLGISMVAEGLENEVTAEYLAELGCNYGQGYLYSQPVPARDVPTLLKADAPARKPQLVA